MKSFRGLLAACVLAAIGTWAAGCGGERVPADNSDAGDSGQMDVEPEPDISQMDSGQTGCWDVGSMSNPSCTEPSMCPSPDSSKEPTITCWNPKWVEAGQNIQLDIYGEYLAKSDGTVDQVSYRSKGEGGAGRITQSVDVKSDCHVSVTLNVSSATWNKCGATVEFRLQRDVPTRQEYKDGYRGRYSAWKEIRVTDAMN